MKGNVAGWPLLVQTFLADVSATITIDAHAAALAAATFFPTPSSTFASRVTVQRDRKTEAGFSSHTTCSETTR
jgi:hypothetical protein